MPITKMEQMLEVLKGRPNKRLVAVWAVDSHTIGAVHEAIQLGIADGILVGNKDSIIAKCAEMEIDPKVFTIVH